MTHEWHDLTDMTGKREFAVTQVRLKDSGIAIEGEFDLPLLAGLRYEDQVFVGEFVRGHGSIKHMEKAFGVSYPTIKNRLNRIAAELPLVRIDVAAPISVGPSSEDRDAETAEVLDLLEAGEITADQAAERLRG